MADETTSQTTPSEQPKPAPSAPAELKRIYLVSYPKVVFLYPTLIAALIGGLYTWIWKATPDTEGAFVMARVFILVMTVNLVVISFDFPRTVSLTIFFAAVALGIGAFTLVRLNADVLPWFNAHIVHGIQPFANATFYFLVSAILIGMFIGVFIAARFDYWEVRPNELLHHHGVLSDLERFSSPNLRITKEINDVFEYLLLRSGRLILHPSNERRAIVLENVFFINRREIEITRMLGALQVQVRSDSNPGA